MVASPTFRRRLGLTCLSAAGLLVANGVYASATSSYTPAPTTTTGCVNGLLNNWSFEAGLKSWTVAPGTLASTGSGANVGLKPVDGTQLMFIQSKGSVGEVWQERSIVAGNEYSLTLGGGTHQPKYGHEAELQFRDATGAVLHGAKVELDHNVGTNGDLKVYSIGPVVAPVGAVVARVTYRNVNGDWIKADAVCLKERPVTPPTTVAPTTTTTVAPTTTTTVPKPTTTAPKPTTTTMPRPQPAALGNYVWLDENGNCLQDEIAAKGVNGVKVTLLDASGKPVTKDADGATIGIQITKNDASGKPGYYLFSNLTPGIYKVSFSAIASGHSPTCTDSGSDDAIDSDGVVTPTVALDAGVSNLTLDLGLIVNVVPPTTTTTLAPKPASLGNYVWVDTNGNCIQDEAATAGVNGVKVTLLDASGNAVTKDATGTAIGVQVTKNDAAGKPGYYLFSNLTPGIYKVSFSNLPAKHTPTCSNGGDDDALDSDGVMTPTVTLAAGAVNLTLDLGLMKDAEVVSTTVVNHPTTTVAHPTTTVTHQTTTTPAPTTTVPVILVKHLPKTGSSMSLDMIILAQALGLIGGWLVISSRRTPATR